MKKLLMMLTLMIGIMSCGSNADNSANAANPVKDRVEVIYFHGKQRCATCMAIEKNAKEAVYAMFADELKNGSVVFRTVDISTPEGEALADKYEVSWSSLYVNKWRGGKETRNDMTKFGFSYARSNPDLFKKGLSDKIRQSLK